MNKKQAIKKIASIQNGKGINTLIFPEKQKADIAKRFWRSGEFNLGMEYGYILALIEVFKIKNKEIK